MRLEWREVSEVQGIEGMRREKKRRETKRK